MAAAKQKVRVIAVEDFDPLQHDNGILMYELVKDAPKREAQLSFHKGQCFEILTKNVKSWWLYVRCTTSGSEEGFIPSTFVVPLKEDLGGEVCACKDLLFYFFSQLHMLKTLYTVLKF